MASRYGVNNKKGMMKTSWGKPEHVILFIRTLLIVLAVPACTVAAEDLETVRKKAEAGDVVAQYNLGVRYVNGEGVAADDVAAVKWFRKAAEQGDAIAQTNLGFMYLLGEGVPEDSVAAYAPNKRVEFNLEEHSLWNKQ